jgi:hypothetical protein
MKNEPDYLMKPEDVLPVFSVPQPQTSADCMMKQRMQLSQSLCEAIVQ